MTVSAQSVSLDRIRQIAAELGFNEDAQRVAAAVARSEGTPIGGSNLIVGDRDANGVGTSFGPFQFHIGGQLNNFAAALGVSLTNASQIANSQQEMAVRWALQNYLGSAILAGQQHGYTGPDLAQYVSAVGQVSQFPEQAAQAYVSLFGAGQAQTQIQPSITQGGNPNSNISTPPASGSRGAFNASGLIVVSIALFAILIGALLWRAQ